jgi:hypothetical protein
MTQLQAYLKQAMSENKALYRSVYLYDENVKEHIEKVGSIRKYMGQRYIDNVIVDIDKGSNSKNQTLKNARNIFYKIVKAGAPYDAILPLFSGSGYHLLLSGSLFDFRDSQDLPYIVKSTMNSLLGKDIDPSVYTRTAIYRVSHTINNKTGLYKIPLSHEEFLQKEAETILKIAESPRLDFRVNKLKSKGQLLTFVTKDEEIPNIKSFKSIKEPKNIVPCVQSLYNKGPQEGNRNMTAMRIASHFKRNGIPSEATKAALVHWNRDSLEQDFLLERVESVYNNGYQYGCNDSILKDNCLTRCIHFKRRDYLVDVKNAGQLQDELHRRMTTDFTGRTIELSKLVGLPDKEITIYPGELVTIFGPTGCNKTTFAQNLILGYDMLNDKMTGKKINTLFLSLELSDWYMHRRNLQIVSGKSKKEVDNNYEKVYNDNKELLEHVMVQTVSPTIEQIKEKIRELQPLCVVIDYIDLLGTPVSYKGEYEQVRYISHSLSNMAVNLDIIIIQISQVSRDYSRNEVLDLYAGKGSGAIENASRKVIGINGRANSNQKVVEMYKNSDGDLFNDVKLEWLPSFRLRRVNESND